MAAVNRPRLHRCALWGLLAACAPGGLPPQSGSGPTSPVQAVSAVGMTVSDLDRSVSFFTDVLSFEAESREELAGPDFSALQGLVSGAAARRIRLRLGDEILELTEYKFPKGRPFPPDTRSNDGWFQHIAIVVTDMDAAYKRLQLKSVRHASATPQRLPDWNIRAAGIRAFYFRDPDGHYLELIQFPPDKGDPKWRRKTDRVFLGIDHTAIVVDDTEASLRFYRDGLGFRVAGQSENFGPEQEALNNVAGAHLRITTLRASAGPGVELLEYIRPRDGRPYPADAQSNDLLYWQTTLSLSRVETMIDRLRRDEQTLGLRGVPPDENCTGEAIVRDPDGHALKLSVPRP